MSFLQSFKLLNFFKEYCFGFSHICNTITTWASLHIFTFLSIQVKLLQYSRKTSPDVRMLSHVPIRREVKFLMGKRVSGILKLRFITKSSTGYTKILFRNGSMFKFLWVYIKKGIIQSRVWWSFIFFRQAGSFWYL